MRFAVSHAKNLMRVRILEYRQSGLMRLGSVISCFFSNRKLKFKIMVTKSDYLKAKEVIKEYEELLTTLIEKGNEWDIDLIPILSTRAKNILKAGFERDSVFISDIINYLKTEGMDKIEHGGEKIYHGRYRKIFWISRNVGIKSYDEIMKHVLPFLK